MTSLKLRAALSFYEFNISENKRHGMTKPLPFVPFMKESEEQQPKTPRATGRARFGRNIQTKPLPSPKTAERHSLLTPQISRNPKVPPKTRISDDTPEHIPENIPALSPTSSLGCTSGLDAFLSMSDYQHRRIKAAKQSLDSLPAPREINQQQRNILKNSADFEDVFHKSENVASGDDVRPEFPECPFEEQTGWE